MRTIIHGAVTARHLADADLMVGITPTSFVTNGLTPPPHKDVPLDAFPICEKQPEETRAQARDYTLVQNADALICVGENDHLVSLARNYDLVVYEVSR